MNNTSTSVEIAWKTSSSIEKSIFLWGESALEYKNLIEIKRGTPSHIYLNHLMPGKRYYYKVQQDYLTAEAWFETYPLPSENNSILFTALGDSGSGFEVQDEVATQMRFRRPNLVLHTGDVIYPKGEGSDLKDKFFDPYHSLMNTSPFYLSLGNHDYQTKEGKEILDAISLPKNDIDNSENFYTFTYGNIRIIALDSNMFITRGFHSTPQWNWLEKVLLNNKSHWTVVFFHHPVFSSGDHQIEPGMHNLHLLFAKYRVDLVLSGHDHHYERTKIIDGVQYIITGGGGANVRTPQPNETTEVAIKAHHFVEVEIKNDTLTIRAINNDGEILDFCTIQKHGNSCQK